MNKAKFLECATLFDNAQKDYFEKIMQAKSEFTKNTQAIEKQFELKIFTKEAMDAESEVLCWSAATDLIDEYKNDEAYLINGVIDGYIFEGEEEYNTKFY
jgi:esterase/lipase superfamily enzyme